MLEMQIEERLSQTVLNSWKLVNQRFSAFISPLSDEDLEKQIAPGRNRVLYIVGHLTATNDRLFSLLGIGERGYAELDTVYINQPDRALEDPVTPSALKTASDDVARRLTEALERFSPEEWLEKHSAVSDEDFAKDPSRNRLAVVLSRTNHMSYHFGQMMLAHNNTQ
jgi:uncharacterized damage-inducible protein DinB